MQIPKRRSDILRRKKEEPLYLTETGYQKLQAELVRLKKAAPELALETARTAAYGDRSDNAEYKEAKRILRGTHYRILTIEDELKRAILITPGRNAAGTIHIGSLVTLEIREAHTKQSSRQFEIVGAHETNPANGRISNESPLGAALLGHVVGDEIIVTTANGTHTYRILKIA